MTVPSVPAVARMQPPSAPDAQVAGEGEEKRGRDTPGWGHSSSLLNSSGRGSAPPVSPPSPERVSMEALEGKPASFLEEGNSREAG